MQNKEYHEGNADSRKKSSRIFLVINRKYAAKVITTLEPIFYH